jgi:hypothetical protein
MESPIPKGAMLFGTLTGRALRKTESLRPAVLRQLDETLGQFRAAKRQELSETWSLGVSGKEHYQKKDRDVKIEEGSRRCPGEPDCAKSRLAERRRDWQTLHFLGSLEG